MIENKNVIVFGGGGSIGSELVRQLALKNKIFVFDINETAMFDLVESERLAGHDVQGRVGDVRDERSVFETIQNFTPYFIFHAAALKHVTPNEQYPAEAVKTNVLGLLNVVAASKIEGSKLIFVSSDKAVNVSSIMGTTKRLGEIIVKNAGYTSVRFGNVLGSRGSLLPIWQAQLEKGLPLTVTDERMTRYFMTIEEACELVIQAAELGQGGEIFVLDMGEPIKIIDFAKRILAESRKDVGIKVIGMRPGEQLFEKLMTDEEKLRAVKQGKFWIIK